MFSPAWKSDNPVSSPPKKKAGSGPLSIRPSWNTPPLSLLKNTVEINTIRLNEPQIHFEQYPDGRWRLPGKATEEARQMTLKTGIFRFNILLKKFLLNEGKVRVSNAAKEILFAAEGVNVLGELQLLNHLNDAKGTLSIRQLQLGSKLHFTDTRSPFEFADSVLKLNELKGHVHGGTYEGAAQLNTGVGGPGFLLNLSLREVDLASLLPDLSSGNNLLQGLLQLQVQLAGDLNQPLLMQGTGSMQIGRARLTGIPALDKLGTMLKLPQIRETEFESIQGNYKVADQRVTFYELEAKSPDLQMTGSGFLGFDRKLDMDVLLILSAKLAAQIPPEAPGSLFLR
ncbi:MAG: AsmA family protein [Blastochloris sp.]|nr:AsmA family protein [Blastochloris sp.]